MTLSSRRRSRRRHAHPPRWLLGLVTLVLALGVVAMHSLGIGHHAPAQGATVTQPIAAPAPTPDHTVGHHSVGGSDGTDAPTAAPTDAPTDASRGVAVEPTCLSAGVATAAGAVVSRATHGATVVCLAVLPLLLLLRRRGERAWFAPGLALARRTVGVATATWSTVRPGRAGPTLSELCILRA